MFNGVVTVGLATYNSSKFIEEALDSVFTQTYWNIELIISDDASKDHTIHLVEQWVERNKHRFVNTIVLKVDGNTGVSANCNRIFNHAQGKYVKLLAGDDILLPNCIEDNINFIHKQPQARVVFSQVGVFYNTYKAGQFEFYKPQDYPHNLMHPTFDAPKQFDILVESDRITYTPSVFFERNAVLEVGGFDETIRLVEDYPMWLKLTESGVKLYYFHQLTVGYRVHSSATNNKGGEVIFPPALINNFYVRKKYAFKHLGWLRKVNETYEHFWAKKFHTHGYNQTRYKRIFYLLTRFLNPFWVFNRLFAQ